MAFYSSGQVKTRYIDPKSFMDGSRAVFELKANTSAYLPNMRLLDIGVFGQNEGVYNRLIGAHAIIKDITLYDGSTVLTQIQEYGLYRGFQNQNIDNVKSQSVEQFKSCNNVGLQKLNSSGLLYDEIRKENTGTTRANTKGAYVELREVLPMLNSVTHLPTAIFRNLRLEVNFNIEVLEQVLMDVTDTITGQMLLQVLLLLMYSLMHHLVFQILGIDLEQVLMDVTDTITGQMLPILAVDVLDDKAVVAKMNEGLGNSIVWLETEVDRVSYPAGVNNATREETKSFKLDGFKGKSLERLLMVKELADINKYKNGNDVLGYGRYQSVALFNEKVQYRVNGRNILSGAGATGAMERLALVVDNYGECFGYPGSAQVDIDSGLIVGLTAANGREKIGNFSYNAIYVGEKVQDLQITHSRTNLSDNAARQASNVALNIVYYGEVRKALIIGNKGYRISYL